jgi:hypothetical protein
MLHPEKYVGSKISTQLSRGQQTSCSFGILPTFGAVDLQMLTGWGNDSLTKVDLKVGEAAFVTRKYHMKKPGPNWRIKATQWDQADCKRMWPKVPFFLPGSVITKGNMLRMLCPVTMFHPQF